MADPLSIAASLAGLITFGAQIGKYILQTYNKLNDGPSSLLHINAEIGALGVILSRLHAFSDSKHDSEVYRSEIRDAIFGPELMNVVTDCTRIMKDLESIVTTISAKPGKGRKMRVFWKDIKWAALDGEIQRMRSQIDTHKATFNLALHLVSTHDAMISQLTTQRIDTRTANMELQMTKMQGLLERLQVNLNPEKDVSEEPSAMATTKASEAYLESVYSAIESSVQGEGSVLSLNDASTTLVTEPDGMSTTVAELESTPEDLHVAELERWLGSVEYKNSYTAFVQRRFADSHLWVFEQPAVKHWFGLRPGYSLLWVNGVAGSGKSVVLSSIIEQAQTQKNATTAYFFCDYDDPNTNNAIGCLKTLIKQILEQNMDLTPMAKPYLSGEGTGSFEMLKALLFNILGTIGIVYLLIDGIDECNTEDKNLLLQLLIELQHLNIRTCRVCVSSRIATDIADRLNGEAASIELRGTLVDSTNEFANRIFTRACRGYQNESFWESFKDVVSSYHGKRSEEEKRDMIRLYMKGESLSVRFGKPEHLLYWVVQPGALNQISFPELVKTSYYRELYRYAPVAEERERTERLLSIVFAHNGIISITDLAAASNTSEDEVERLICAFPSVVLYDKYRTVRCRSEGILRCMQNLLNVEELSPKFDEVTPERVVKALESKDYRSRDSRNLNTRPVLVETIWKLNGDLKAVAL